MIVTNRPMKAISFPSGETSNLAVLCSEPEVLVRQGTYSISLFPLIKLVICNHLNTLARQHVVDEEVWVELGAHDELVAARGESCRLDREVLEVYGLDLGVLLAVNLGQGHVTLLTGNWLG